MNSIWTVVGCTAGAVSVVLAILGLVFKAGYLARRVDSHGYRIKDLEEKDDARALREIQQASDLGEMKGTLKVIHDGVEDLKVNGCAQLRKGGACKQ